MGRVNRSITAFEGSYFVVALRFESAFAIDVLVSWIGEADSAHEGRAVAFAAFGLRTFGR